MNSYTDKVDNIWISGGLANLDGLCQRLANLTGLPVKRAPQCEASAQGLAFLLAQPHSEWLQLTPDLFEPIASSKLLARYQQWKSALHDWL